MQRSTFQCQILAQGNNTCEFFCKSYWPMCHLYAVGLCDCPWQDWCEAGWHVTKKDWCTRCASLSKEKRRNEEGAEGSTFEPQRRRVLEEGAEGSTLEPQRRRVLDGEVEWDDL